MGNNKKQAKSAAENPIIIIAVFLVLVAITLIASFAVAKANKIDITELVLNGDIELQVGEEEAVGFNVATAKTEDNDKVVAAVNRLKLVWTVENESVAVYDDSEGVLRGVSEGFTILTLATEDGKFSDSCTVTVVPAEAGQTLESAAATAETAGRRATSWPSSPAASRRAGPRSSPPSGARGGAGTPARRQRAARGLHSELRPVWS